MDKQEKGGEIALPMDLPTLNREAYPKMVILVEIIEMTLLQRDIRIKMEGTFLEEAILVKRVGMARLQKETRVRMGGTYLEAAILIEIGGMILLQSEIQIRMGATFLEMAIPVEIVRRTRLQRETRIRMGGLVLEMAILVAKGASCHGKIILGESPLEMGIPMTNLGSVLAMVIQREIVGLPMATLEGKDGNFLGKITRGERGDRHLPRNGIETTSLPIDEEAEMMFRIVPAAIKGGRALLETPQWVGGSMATGAKAGTRTCIARAFPRM
jgi:hypothetical protein